MMSSIRKLKLKCWANFFHILWSQPHTNIEIIRTEEHNQYILEGQVLYKIRTTKHINMFLTEFWKCQFHIFVRIRVVFTYRNCLHLTQDTDIWFCYVYLKQNWTNSINIVLCLVWGVVVNKVICISIEEKHGFNNCNSWCWWTTYVSHHQLVS